MSSIKVYYSRVTGSRQGFEMLYQATENEEVSKFLKMTSKDKPV